MNKFSTVWGDYEDHYCGGNIIYIKFSKYAIKFTSKDQLDINFVVKINKMTGMELKECCKDNNRGICHRLIIDNMEFLLETGL